MHSIWSRLQREHAEAGVWTISHRSYDVEIMFSIIIRAVMGHGHDSNHGETKKSQRTFCCLHSLQAFLFPPLRLPVIGGTGSISHGSEFLDRSKPFPRDGLVRMSLLGVGGVIREPWGGRALEVMTPRKCRSISLSQQAEWSDRHAQNSRQTE